MLCSYKKMVAVKTTASRSEMKAIFYLGLGKLIWHSCAVMALVNRALQCNDEQSPMFNYIFQVLIRVLL